MESKYNSSVKIWFIQRRNFFFIFENRNLKPDSIYLRGENNEENCSVVIGDLIPVSVAYDLRMRTRLPRRMYSYLLRFFLFTWKNSDLLIDKSSCNRCHSKRKNILQFACFILRLKKIHLIVWVFLLLGALSYTAPEIFEGGDYTIQSDIYSFGCILLDMITCDTLTVRYHLKLVG